MGIIWGHIEFRGSQTKGYDFAGPSSKGFTF